MTTGLARFTKRFSILTGLAALAIGCAASSGGGTAGANGDGGASSGNGDGVGDDGIQDDGLPGPSDACAVFEATAANQTQPSDIIIAIDQSGSMDTETAWVEAQLSGFAQQITASGIDVHVVVIAGKPGSENGFCVPAPLGSGSCPADDNLPALMHVNKHVDSHDALSLILTMHSSYQQALRPEARKHIVVISDDDADMSAQTFHSYVTAADASYADYMFHAIVANTGSCPYAADEGKEYKQLVAMTGGVMGDLCQQDFLPVWDELSTHVADNATLACEWEIPEPPAGQVFADDEVNVRLTTDGSDKNLGFVQTLADCADVSDGWVYDDAAAPTAVHACPQTCDALQLADTAEVSITFGCATIPAQPK